MEKLRTVIFYKDYFDSFFSKQSKKVKAKIIWTIEVVETQKNIPEVYFKHIENTRGVYEIRVQQASNILLFRQWPIDNFNERISKENPKNTQTRNRTSY
jgi:Phage derived protein Gp49-like (DUF891)